MQLVDINRGPLARAVGLSELKLVTAAAASNVTIPGLPEAGRRRAARPARLPRREPPGRAVTEPASAPGRTPVATENLADGEWHRLHPATPLLRGGLALIAILGIIVANLRERIIEIFFGGGFGEGDPVDEIVDRGLVPLALVVVAVALLLFIGGFYLSWRMHTFRITDEQVEVRSGILFRTNRKGRLDRIQGINIVRPLFARLFGAARLEITVAGGDGNVQLAYLSGVRADELRRDILLLASGTQQAEGGGRRARRVAPRRASSSSGSTSSSRPSWIRVSPSPRRS